FCFSYTIDKIDSNLFIQIIIYFILIKETSSYKQYVKTNFKYYLNDHSERITTIFNDCFDFNALFRLNILVNVNCNNQIKSIRIRFAVHEFRIESNLNLLVEIS